MSSQLRSSHPFARMARGASLALLLVPALAPAAVITWSGAAGDSLWTNPGNWRGNALPGPADEVVIPPRAGVVEIASGAQRVARVTAADGLTISGSASLALLAGPSEIRGRFGLGENASLSVTGPDTVLDVQAGEVECSGDLYARKGAVINLPSLGQIEDRRNGVLWQVEDPKSAIIAPKLSKVLIPSSAVFRLNAYTGGYIDVSGISQDNLAIWATARDKSEINLSGQRGAWSGVGTSYGPRLVAENGGRIRMPNVTSLDQGEIIFDAADAIPTAQLVSLTRSTLTISRATPDFNALTNLNETDIYLSAGAVLRIPRVVALEDRGNGFTWQADQAGTLLDASAVEKITHSSTAGHRITVQNGARVDLSGLRGETPALWVTARTGGEVDLSSMGPRWSGSGHSYGPSLVAQTSGRIHIPKVVEFDSGELTVDSADAVPTAQFTAFTRSILRVSRATLPFANVKDVDASDLYVSDGAVLRLEGVTSVTDRQNGMIWQVEQAGSVLDASRVTRVIVPTSSVFRLNAFTGGFLDMSGLAQEQVPIWATARARGVIDLSGMRGLWSGMGTSYGQNLIAQTEGKILLPNVTEFDAGEITMDAADAVNTAQFQSFTRSILRLARAEAQFNSVTNVDDSDIYLTDGAQLRLPKVLTLTDRGNGMIWQAEEPETLIEAPALHTVVLNRSSGFRLNAYTRARIDLRNLSVAHGPFWITVRTGGQVDLRSLSGFWSTEGFSYGPSFIAESEGSILIPGIRGLERATILIRNNGVIPTSQLERVLDSQVTVDNAVANFASLRDQTDSTFRELNGGRITYASGPRILDQPSNISARIGDSVEFAVDASGDQFLSFQWLKNGQILPGATTATLRLDNIQVSDAGDYSVAISNPGGTIISAPATLSLLIPSLPATDLFAARGRITTAQGAGAANNFGAAVEPFEPRHAGKRGGRSVWVTWRAPETGVATITTAGSSYDTTLAIYTGNALTGLEPVASDEDSGGFLTSRVQFNAIGGTEYHVAIDGYAGATGNLILSWSLDPAGPQLPEIATQPLSQVVPAGDTAVLQVVARPANVQYQWFQNGRLVPGATNAVWTLANADRSDVGVWTVRVRTPEGGEVESAPAVVELRDRSLMPAPPSADKLDDLFSEEEAAAGFVSLIPGRGLAAAPPPSVGIPGSHWTDNSGSTRSPDDPTVCDVLTSATRWFRLRFNLPPGNTEPITLTTEGSEIATLLAVFTNRLDLTLIACDTAAPPERPSAAVQFVPVRDVDYLVLVDGINGATGGIQLNWAAEALTPPLVTTREGRFYLETRVTPGLYTWQTATAVEGPWQTLFETNLTTGEFLFHDPQIASEAARFYRLTPVGAEARQ